MAGAAIGDWSQRAAIDFNNRLILAPLKLPSDEKDSAGQYENGC